MVGCPSPGIWAENHCPAVALHFIHYNFVCIHKTIEVTPAMAAEVTELLSLSKGRVQILKASSIRSKTI